MLKKPHLHSVTRWHLSSDLGSSIKEGAFCLIFEKGNIRKYLKANCCQLTLISKSSISIFEILLLSEITDVYKALQSNNLMINACWQPYHKLA